MHEPWPRSRKPRTRRSSAHVRKMTDAFKAAVGGGESGAGADACGASPCFSLEAVVRQLARGHGPAAGRLGRRRRGGREGTGGEARATSDVDVAAALSRAAAVAAARDAEFEVFDFEAERVRRAEEAEEAKARESVRAEGGEETEETVPSGDAEDEDATAAVPPSSSVAIGDAS